jgi:hypothetical protein
MPRSLPCPRLHRRACFRGRSGRCARPLRKSGCDESSRSLCHAPVPKVFCYEDKSPDARRIKERRDARTPSRKVEEHALLASSRPGDLAFPKCAKEQANHCGRTASRNVGRQAGQFRRVQPHVRGSLGHALPHGGPRSVVAVIGGTVCARPDATQRVSPRGPEATERVPPGHGCRGTLPHGGPRCVVAVIGGPRFAQGRTRRSASFQRGAGGARLAMEGHALSGTLSRPRFALALACCRNLPPPARRLPTPSSMVAVHGYPHGAVDLGPAAPSVLACGTHGRYIRRGTLWP